MRHKTYHPVTLIDLNINIKDYFFYQHHLHKPAGLILQYNVHNIWLNLKVHNIFH